MEVQEKMSRFLRFFRIIAIAFLCAFCSHAANAAGSFTVGIHTQYGAHTSNGTQFCFFFMPNPSNANATVNWGDGSATESVTDGHFGVYVNSGVYEGPTCHYYQNSNQ